MICMLQNYMYKLDLILHVDILFMEVESIYVYQL